jgi:XTP/dITP diphosphohydrolase
MKLRLASGNPHKARELAVLLPGWQLEPLDSQDMPEETGATFHENASAKAHFGRTIADPDAWVLGEDSGLEVVGLAGRPGIRSARFAGPGSTDEQNLQLLLEELAGMAGEARRARYVCELVCVSPELVEFRGRGTLAGRIAEEPRGAAGFGYDPVFVPQGETRTVAELGDEWKARHSHRARAALALREAMRGSTSGG